MNLEKRCEWYVISRSQRKLELWRGEGYEGTRSYEERGCYECKGWNEDCKYKLDFYRDIRK